MTERERLVEECATYELITPKPATNDEITESEVCLKSELLSKIKGGERKIGAWHIHFG